MTFPPIKESTRIPIVWGLLVETDSNQGSAQTDFLDASALLLQPDRPVLQPQVRRLALPAALGVERVPGPTPEADLEEEPPLLGNLLLSSVGYGQSFDLVEGPPSS